MDKGMCIFQSNKNKSALQNHSYSSILSRWAVVYPDTSTPSIPLCLEVCVRGGVQGSAACNQNFVRDSATCVMAFRGVSLGP